VWTTTWTTTLPERPSLGQWESADKYTQVSKMFTVVKLTEDLTYF
jgi:hypothetical protein